jgi:tetratricopeptide (TPR) repeat protein
MATVYLARDLKQDRAVAIKVLGPEWAEASVADRFLREIRITSTLRHPNILALLDSGVAVDCPWYAMPFIEGESLRQKLDRAGGQLALAQVVHIGRQVAAALDYAHGLGIVHRDIKPENVLLSGEQAWVADFGIARIPLNDGDVPLTSASVAIGTPNYMSPEQARGGQSPVDGRSDIYSLGCVIYEMLVGIPPFAGGTREAILARHALDPVPPVQTVRPTVGPAADAVVRKFMAKSPADRFSTATQAVDALEASFAQGPRIPTRRLIVGALGVAAIALVLIALPGRANELDSHRVLVLPVVNRGSMALAGEDIATALADAFNTTDSLIASVAAGSDSTDRESLPDELVARLGRSRNARYVITGRLTPDASPRLEVRLHDLSNGSFRLRDVDVPDATDAFSIARQAARVLLPDLIRTGGALVDLNLLSADPPALAAYLQGERTYRRGDYRGADSLFGVAVARDSNFAWAALRGAQAANWLTQRPRAAQFLAVAFRKIDSLPPRYASFARGLAAYGAGDADSAVAYFRSALAVDPRWAEAHHALGEVYQHYVPSTGYPLETAAAEFDSALAHDPTFTAPLFHAIQHAIWKGDRPRVDSLFRRFSAVAPGNSDEREQLELMRGCLDEPPSATAWQKAAARSMNSAAQAAAWLVVAGLRYPDCSRHALEAVLADSSGEYRWRYYGILELASVHAAQSNVAEVRRLLRELGTAADLMTLFLASAGLPMDDFVDSAATRLRERTDSATADLRAWAVGTWEIQRGDSVGARSALADLTMFATGKNARRARLLRESLRARLALARGDTASAIELLERVVPTADQGTLRWNPWSAMPWERLQLAQLLAVRGRRPEAARVAAGFDSPASYGFLPWLPQSLRLREQLERSLGDVRFADALERRLRTFSHSSPVGKP